MKSKDLLAALSKLGNEDKEGLAKAMGVKLEELESGLSEEKPEVGDEKAEVNASEKTKKKVEDRVSVFRKMTKVMNTATCRLC